jgi:hypothetical protein
MEKVLLNQDLDNLLDRLPLDAKKELKKFLADSVYYDEFIDRIGTYNSIEELQANYHLEMEDKMSRDVFIIQPKGLGMGEVWIAWLVKDVIINGGGESFDILSNGAKYEAKAYNFFPHYKTKKLQLQKYEGVWRLGNAGAMSNFKFMQHLIHVVDVAHELLVNDIDASKSPALQLAIENIKEIEKLSPKYGMIGDFARGEISKEKMRLIIEVIDLLHKHVSEFKSDYDIVTFASSTPGNPNMSFLIESTSEESIAKGEFTVIKPVDLADISNPISLKRMLVKSNYIREGITEMIKDINNDICKVEDKYDDVSFIIFRKSGMYISSDLNKIKGNTLQDLKDAVGMVFNVSSASVRVREKV